MDQTNIQPAALDHFKGDEFSPYRFFTADKWAEFRADTPLTLTEDEVRRLRSLNDPVNLDEVRRIYLSLSRLLSAHVESSQLLFEQRMHTAYWMGNSGSIFWNSLRIVSSLVVCILMLFTLPFIVQGRGRREYNIRIKKVDNSFSLAMF